METVASSAKYKYVSSGLNTLHYQGPSPPIYFQSVSLATNIPLLPVCHNNLSAVPWQEGS